MICSEWLGAQLFKNKQKHLFPVIYSVPIIWFSTTSNEVTVFGTKRDQDLGLSMNRVKFITKGTFGKFLSETDSKLQLETYQIQIRIVFQAFHSTKNDAGPQIMP